MRKLYYSFFILLFLSCGNENITNKQSEISVLETQKFDSLVIPNKDSASFQSSNDTELNVPLFYGLEEMKVLNHYYGDTLSILLDSNQFLLKTAQTDLEVLSTYKSTVKIIGLLTEKVFSLNLPNETKDGGWYPDYVIQDLKPIDEFSLGITSSCVAECSEFSIAINLNQMIQLASQTTGDLDDEFFHLLFMADGEFGGDGTGWHTWFARTWDYGGGSLLGDSSHYEFLVKMNQFKQKYKGLNELLDLYKYDLLNDIQHGIYMYSMKEVINEMERILHLNFLIAKDKMPIEHLLERFKKDEMLCDQCPGGAFQFGCAQMEKNCNWGG